MPGNWGLWDEKLESDTSCMAVNMAQRLIPQKYSSFCCCSLPLFVSQDTVTGFLLAGIGHRTAKGSNFLIVKQDTKLQLVEEAFQDFSTRDDVGIILINQHVANDIRHVLKDYNETIPTVLEIPSKEHPYDPEQDYIMVSFPSFGPVDDFELMM